MSSIEKEKAFHNERFEGGDSKFYWALRSGFDEYPARISELARGQMSSITAVRSDIRPLK